ncbi:hypothetical protein AAFF_G00439480 [Aldrovandia affinis]|uniref:Retinoic acid receptor responder protein 2 n=1 Tax=Aldrovandia affinis TaxID=143900 RepID=A0AAD7S7I5_9TELE|nr:hypothetical protein AAFF_G00439480 [Aldrovandia affinis]
MCRPLLILLLITGALLISTEGQQSYQMLQDILKDTVNQAIEQVNKNVNQHMNFVGFLPESENFYYEFHLRATQCGKTGNNTHREECEFLITRPKINCAVCKEDVQNQPSNRSIHCLPQMQANKAADRRNKSCSKYNVGEGSLLQQREINAAPECLGCL